VVVRVSLWLALRGRVEQAADQLSSAADQLFAELDHLDVVERLGQQVFDGTAWPGTHGTIGRIAKPGPFPTAIAIDFDGRDFGSWRGTPRKCSAVTQGQILRGRASYLRWLKDGPLDDPAGPCSAHRA
jgi:hypothetical protein